ncbi:MAG TPA: dTDP-glucose 4,6-dehydratase [Ktedonobacterales bacterium]|nr:dTDP-glucose 4,6-dehydratase [Ktedonobacterales bacterium]
MASRKMLVTGAAGFIGSAFVRYAMRALPDVEVIAFDKLTYAGNLENLAAVAHDPRYSFVQGDICDAEAVRASMRDCVWVVNFAAETHVDRSIVDPGAFVRTDVIGAYELLEAARSLGVERFVQISTDEVYGNAEAPSGESRPSLETDALKPLSPYAASKAGADRLAFSYWATYGVPVVVTRCSNNYGPYQYPEKQLPLFITNALAGRAIPVYGNGKNTRDWIHTDDHCSALLAILQAPADTVVGEVFNIGSDEEHSILQNAATVLATLGKPESMITFVPDRLGHVRRHAVNSAKLRARLGWAPRVTFEDGIAQAIAWYRDNTAWLDNLLARQDAFLDKALTLATSES